MDENNDVVVVFVVTFWGIKPPDFTLSPPIILLKGNDFDDNDSEDDDNE